MEYSIHDINVDHTKEALHKAAKVALYSIYDTYHCIIDNDDITAEDMENVYKAVKTLHYIGCMTTGHTMPN